jgi:hypothetical protein
MMTGMHAAGQSPVGDVLTETMLDPEFGRRLLMRSTSPNRSSIMKALLSLSGVGRLA